MEKNLAIINVTFEQLERALGLKDTCEIVDIFYSENQKYCNAFSIKIKSTGLPFRKEGEQIICIPIEDVIK